MKYKYIIATLFFVFIQIIGIYKSENVSASSQYTFNSDCGFSSTKINNLEYYLNTTNPSDDVMIYKRNNNTIVIKNSNDNRFAIYKESNGNHTISYGAGSYMSTFTGENIGSFNSVSSTVTLENSTYPVQCVYKIRLTGNSTADYFYNHWYDEHPESFTLVSDIEFVGLENPNITKSPELKYKIIGDKGKFELVNIPEENAEYAKWLITYGSIEGDPQVETWQGFDVSSKPLNFTFPYIAEKGQNNIYGTYTISVKYADENENDTSNETYATILLREDYYNNFQGTCQGEACNNENTIGNGALSYDFDNCTWSETYPYLDVTACKNKIGQLMGILNFDKLKYGDNFTGDTTQCHELGIIVNWLNLDENDRTICPQFSSEIRNTVTPFITMGLGLVMISFVGKRGIDYDGE